MKTITVCQRKGGNGKLTSALNLAHSFVLSGLRVLLVDLDEQKNTTSAIATDAMPPLTIENLLIDSAVSVCDVAVPTLWDGISLIAASSSLSGAVGNSMGMSEATLSCGKSLRRARIRTTSVSSTPLPRSTFWW